MHSDTLDADLERRFWMNDVRAFRTTVGVSDVLTCAVPGAKAAVTFRSSANSRPGWSCDTVSTALGVCAARTWISHSRRTAKLPGPWTATVTLPMPVSPARRFQVITSR